MIYLFEHPETGELRDVFFNVNDEKIYEDGGVVWQRRWTPPQLSIDTKIDPYSEKQFLDKTRKCGKIGDLWDRSAELSAIRAEKEGTDFVKDKFEEDCAKVRKGKKNPRKLKDIEVELKVK